MDAGRQPVRLDVFSDVACPWCFIGFRNLQRARSDWYGPPLDIHWRAFQLRPDHPPRGIPFAGMVQARFGGPEGYAAATAHLVAVGARAGIPFAMDLIRVSPNTRLAHAVIAAAGPAGHADAVVEALFAGYFCEGVDITDPAALVALLAYHDADPDPAGLVAQGLSGDLDASVEADLQVGAEIGVRAVPVFIADGTRGIVGAHPPDALRQLLRGEFGEQ